MLVLLSLLAMTPYPGAVRSGPPVPHLARTPTVQFALSNRADWRGFRARWGSGWTARWNERTGAPRFVGGPGVPVSDLPGLLANLAALSGVDPTELVADPVQQRGERRWHHFHRTWHGATVVGDEVLALEQGGQVAGIWVRLHPIAMTERPAAGEAVVAMPNWKQGEPWVAPAEGVDMVLVTVTTADGITTWRDRGGSVVHRWTDVRYDDVQLSVLERTIGDAHIAAPLRLGTVTDGEGAVDTTADDGSHGLTGTLTVELDGPELQVLKRGSDVTVTAAPDAAGTLLLTGGEDISDASASVQHHFHGVWDWLKDRRPAHPWLASKVVANVDINSSACNAYYTSGTINFFVGAGSYCYNYGKIADVIYHEVGHGIHQYILTGGTFAGDISEGSADYVSSTILDDATVGANARPDGSAIRELDTDRVYPDDLSGEVHNDGLIWASFLWNLRAQWEADMGDPAGIEATDLLFLGALEQGPTLTDAYEAVILADDDNGDLSDGTPHACDLVTLLDQHGLGPGPIGVLSLNHTPLGPQTSTTLEYAVQFSIHDATVGCSDFDPDSVQLWFSTDPALPVPGTVLPEETTDPYAGWTALTLSTDGLSWTGELPRQLATTEVRYFIEASTTDGEASIWSHGGTVDGVYRFRVGDREAVWCEDFESGEAVGWVTGGGLPESPGGGVDEWEVGTATGGRFVPAAARVGSYVMGTRLSGEYAANNRQFATMPEVAVDPSDRMLMLSYWRYLTVEDARYDQAGLQVNGVAVFENQSTGGGTTHTLDVDWTLHDIVLQGIVDDGTVQADWTLQSDGGLEFGGWTLDEVCVVRLADEAAHYRRVDLTATDDGDGLELRWDNPWIEPLADVALVRLDGDWPASPDDGRVLLHLTDAVPGETVAVREPALEPGETRHYVVFAAKEPGDWFLDRVVGDNALRVSEDALVHDTGGVDSGWVLPDEERPVPDPVDDEDDAAPVDGDTPAPSKDGGCSTAGGGGGVWWTLLPGLVVLRRRR